MPEWGKHERGGFIRLDGREYGITAIMVDHAARAAWLVLQNRGSEGLQEYAVPYADGETPVGSVLLPVDKRTLFQGSEKAKRAVRRAAYAQAAEGIHVRPASEAEKYANDELMKNIILAEHEAARAEALQEARRPPVRETKAKKKGRGKHGGTRKKT